MRFGIWGLVFGLVLMLFWVDWLWLGLGLGLGCLWLPLELQSDNRSDGSLPLLKSRVLCVFPFSFAFSRPRSIGLLCGAALLGVLGWCSSLSSPFFRFFPAFSDICLGLESGFGE